MKSLTGRKTWSAAAVLQASPASHFCTSQPAHSASANSSFVSFCFAALPERCHCHLVMRDTIKVNRYLISLPQFVPSQFFSMDYLEHFDHMIHGSQVFMIILYVVLFNIGF